MTAASLLAAILAGCPSANTGTTTTTDNGPGDVVEQNSNLFVPQSDPKSYRFSTNDSAYWGPNGYTLWGLSLAGQIPFLQRDVTLVKTSGNTYAGYGVVFCEYETGTPAVETMLLVMINTQQQYSVGSVTGSDYTPYTNPMWIQDLHLNRGYGIANEVKITRDANGLFTLSLNNNQVMTFQDGRAPVQTGGGDGFLVVISPQDSFPQIPVTVSYTEN